MTDIVAKCELCGEPMPPGETMFKYHGYSGPCPKEPLPRAPVIDWQDRCKKAEDKIIRLRAEEYNYAITCRAIPDEFALEPPDGGEVKPWEAVSEMANTINRLRNALLKLTDHFNHGDKWSGQTRGETIQAVEKFARAALEGRNG